ncbi:type II toxin-antitoxin system RelE/ParE family toxin [Methylopila henanensis]|uniref:Type II toxin-antitoxin system RelE/ParE family toxin n=1 Tax=Methylopila henanensis TaxID=873516 RepID=A0ABW4KBH7_9HYPH
MKLRVQKRALRQIEDALTYIAAESPQGAANVEARIVAAFLQVQRYPFLGRPTPITGVRRMVLTPFPYHFDYFVGSDEVVVQRFRHAARRPSGD